MLLQGMEPLARVLAGQMPGAAEQVVQCQLYRTILLAERRGQLVEVTRQPLGQGVGHVGQSLNQSCQFLRGQSIQPDPGTAAGQGLAQCFPSAKIARIDGGKQAESRGCEAGQHVIKQLKNNYCAFNGNVVYKDTDPFKYDLPNSWSILLSPQMFYQFGENIEDWERIIKKSAWNMAGYRDDPHNAHNVFVKEQLWELCRFMQEKEIDVSYLNWVCDLYHSVPLFLEYTLLIILQIFSERCDSEQLKKRVKLMFMSYPLSPEKINLEATEKIGGISGMRLSKRYINFVKTMSMSHSLLGRLSQHRIHQQFHHQPAGNSRIIPEKLMSGDPAFLNVSKSTSYKPIIFDCASLRGREVESKIYRQMASGIKSEIRLICQNGMIGKYKILFFHWLAAHHMNDTISPIWLMRDYQCYGETAQPFRQSNLVVSDDCYYLETRLKLPPERIRDYFNQPSAVVLQNDDLLALLDEFLALIAT